MLPWMSANPLSDNRTQMSTTTLLLRVLHRRCQLLLNNKQIKWIGVRIVGNRNKLYLLKGKFLSSPGTYFHQLIQILVKPHSQHLLQSCVRFGSDIEANLYTTDATKYIIFLNDRTSVDVLYMLYRTRHAT